MKDIFLNDRQEFSMQRPPRSTQEPAARTASRGRPGSAVPGPRASRLENPRSAWSAQFVPRFGILCSLPSLPVWDLGEDPCHCLPRPPSTYPRKPGCCSSGSPRTPPASCSPLWGWGDRTGSKVLGSVYQLIFIGETGDRGQSATRPRFPLDGQRP